MTSDWWDDDIAAMELSREEKNGLQVFRNYDRAFSANAVQRFIATVDEESFDTGVLERVVSIVANDDYRLVTIVACAFSDDLLKDVFKELATERAIGNNAAALLGPLGPLGDFSKRIQVAAIFDVMSIDLLTDLDRLRSARNKIAHAWEQRGHEDLLTSGKAAGIFPIEDLLRDQARLSSQHDRLSQIDKLRIRTIWLLARVSYEGPLYVRARTARLHPLTALYGHPRPRRLTAISAIADAASERVLAGAGARA